MKKLLSLFVPLMALFLIIAPQTARAQLNEYFYITGGNINVTFTGSPGTDLYYSTDRSSWTQITSTQTLNASSTTYYFKGTNNDPNGSNGFSKDEDNYVSFQLKTTGVDYTVGGNIMSLVNASDFSTNYSTIPADHCFYALFKGSEYADNISSSYTESARINASSLACPATNLTKACYKSMFESTGVGITGLPTFPATALAEECYARMFYGNVYMGNTANTNGAGSCDHNCGKTYSQMENILRTRVLSATTLARSCYAEMFCNCSYIPKFTSPLPATEMQPYCYKNMFKHTTMWQAVGSSIGVNIDLSNVTKLADGCFYGMFQDNNSYTPSVVMPMITKLKEYCYAYMFANSKLTTPPALPATRLEPYCYFHMFDGCTSLSSFPALPAPIATDYCYAYMFNNCSSLTTGAEGTKWILPLEELAPHCCEGMFSLATASSSPAKYRIIEIMATSLKDRKDSEIENCLSKIFEYTSSSAIGNYYYIYNTIHFMEWGSDGNTAATYDWCSGNYTNTTTRFRFYLNNDLPHTGTYKSTANPARGNHMPYFCKNCSILVETNSYLTFNVNGGTWENDGTYQQDIRRYVRADYTAKTIPAPPVKAGSRFIGWFTTKDDINEVGKRMTEEQLKQVTTNTIVYARFVDDSKYTLTILPNDNATITARVGDDTYTAGVHEFDSNDKTFTFDYSDVAPGFFFDRWTGGNFNGNTVTFGTEKDLVISAVFVEPDYFTITNNSTAAKNVTVKKGAGTDTQPSFKYRILNANGTINKAWDDLSVTNTSGTSISVPIGGKLQMYGNNKTLGTSADDYTTIAMANNNTSIFKISGNILFLVAYSSGIDVDDFEMQSYCFYKLFSGHSFATLDAGDLKLPSTKVASYGYANMFDNCQYLTDAPKELPATELEIYSYQCMFQTCSRLTKAPDILYDGSTNPNYVFNQMFSGCSKLNYVRTYHKVWTGSNAFTSWMNSVPNTGVFYCSPDLSNSTFGAANVPKSNNYKWTVYSYDVTFKVKSGNTWATDSHFDWKEDVSVINEFLDAEDENETEFFTDEDCTPAHKISISDIKGALPRAVNTTPQPAKTYYMRRVSSVSNYDVTLDPNNGTTGNEQIVSATNGSPMPLTLNDGSTPVTVPSRTGYDFVGYYDTDASTDGKQYYTYIGTPTKALGSACDYDLTTGTTLYARWEAQTYTITYRDQNSDDTFSGTQTGAPTTHTYGTATTLMIPTRAGYDFAGWFTAKNCASGAIGNTTTAALGANEYTANIILYAKWTAHTYTVTFDGNGSTDGSMENQAFTYGTAQQLRANGFTRAYTVTYNYHGATGGNSTENNTATYTFDHWTYNATNYSNQQSVNNLTTTNDGTVTMTAQWTSGSVTLPSPEKTGCDFKGWYTEASGGTRVGGAGDSYTPTAGVTLHAQWETSKYTVTIEVDGTNNWGTVTAPSIPNVPHGATISVSDNTITINGITVTANSTSPNTAEWTYGFSAWKSGETALTGSSNTVTGAMTIKANFSRTKNNYTVAFVKNEDGWGSLTATEITSVPYGTDITISDNQVTINGTTITATAEEATAQYTYGFGSWSKSPDNATVTGAMTVTANFTQTTKQYTLTVNADANGTVTGGGTYNYGASAELTATPAEGYHFVSWSDGGAQTHSVIVTDITAAQTYTATFAPNATYYMLTISAGENGTVDTSVNGSKEEGTNVQISATANTFYQFDQWSDGNKDNPRTVTMNEDKTLTASFKTADVIVLEDSHEANTAWWSAYSNLVTALGGTTVTVQYNRTLTAGQWNVVSLPFEFNLMQHKSHPFSRHIYEMKDATYTTDGYLDFNFIPMTTIMTPNKPYIFYSETPVNNVSFADVELNAVESYTGDDVKFAVTGGELMFRNTTYREKLNSAGDENKSIIYIYDNRLYYPKTNEIWMRAFRGYFKLDVDNIYYVTPRVRIITGGQVTTALEAAESGNGTEVRKYVESGILVIERNGVKYNAQGGRIE